MGAGNGGELVIDFEGHGLAELDMAVCGAVVKGWFG
jgi:hypothetical protein